MPKRKRTKGKKLAAAQFQLPEPMIQHIQSFLTAKEAARTIILSKSWHNAWLTRPNLDFIQDDFKKEFEWNNEMSSTRLWEFVNKVMQRYEKLNLKIYSFRLWLLSYKDAKLCEELILKAMKMGATALDLKFSWEFDLPNEVFECENLVTLSLSGCQICVGDNGKISCSRLKSLTLDKVCYKFSEIMWRIVECCPLVENLSWSSHPDFEFRRTDVGLIVDSFRNLKSFSLSVDRTNDDVVLEISNPSLECISFSECISKFKTLRGRFDVPSLRKFTFSGSNIPKVSFEGTTSSWESNVSIKRYASPPSVTWFHHLNRLLKALSVSKVSLALDILSDKRVDCVGKFPSFTRPEVENLAVNGPYAVDPAFFYCLFHCCRPTYITQRWFPKSTQRGGMRTDDVVELVYKRMMHQVSLNSFLVYQKTSRSCNVEEACVEFYDESVSAWRPRLDTSTSLGDDEQRIRVHLKWGH